MRPPILKILLLIPIWISFLNQSAKANHIYGGDISYIYDADSDYTVNVFVYRDCSSKSLSSICADINVSTDEGCLGGFVSIGGKICCAKDITPISASGCDICQNSTCSFGFGIQKVLVSTKTDIIKKYHACCNFTFSYSCCCDARSNNFYIECTLNLCHGEQSSPAFEYDPIAITCLGQIYQGYQSAIPGNRNDSMSYAMVDPLNYHGSTISYQSPYTSKTPITYQGTDPDAPFNVPFGAGFHFNSVTAKLQFKPTKVETSFMAFEAREYRKDSSGKYYLAGTTMRRSDINVVDCNNKSRTPIIYGLNGKFGDNDTLITCAGIPLSFSTNILQIISNDTIKLSIANETSGKINISQKNGSYSYIIANFSWTPKNKDIRKIPYLLTYTATDQGTPIPAMMQRRFYIFVKDSFPKISGIKITDSSCGRYHIGLDTALAKNLNMAYQWRVDNTLVSTQPDFSYKTISAGLHTVSLVLTNPAGCNLVITNNFTYDNSYHKLLANVNLCYGHPVALHAANISNPKWSPKIGLSDSGITNPVANPDITTTYTITGKDSTGCVVSDKTTVGVTKIVPSVYGNSPLCYDSSTTLYAYGGNSYLWGSDGPLDKITGASIKIHPLKTSRYFVTVTDTIHGCSAVDSFTILVSHPPKTYPTQTVCLGEGVSLHAANGTSYTWFPSVGLDQVHAKSPTASPIANTKYTVTIADSIAQCQHTDTVQVFVDADCVWPGDANNDKTSDYLDVLQIGLHYGAKGPARAPGTNVWDQYPCNNWSQVTPDSINYKHIDCNGDGIINTKDTKCHKCELWAGTC